MNRKEEIQIEIWDRLVQASHSRHDPFHHLVLATVEGNRPRARTVILRNANSEDATLRGDYPLTVGIYGIIPI